MLQTEFFGDLQDPRAENQHDSDLAALRHLQRRNGRQGDGEDIEVEEDVQGRRSVTKSESYATRTLRRELPAAWSADDAIVKRYDDCVNDI